MRSKFKWLVIQEKWLLFERTARLPGHRSSRAKRPRACDISKTPDETVYTPLHRLVVAIVAVVASIASVVADTYAVVVVIGLFV